MNKIETRAMYEEEEVEEKVEKVLKDDALLTKGDDKMNYDQDQVILAYIDKYLPKAEFHLDSHGIVDFDYFLKVYKAALVWNRVRFMERRKSLLTLRRQAFEENKMDNYRSVHQAVSDADEMCLQDVLEDTLKQVGLTDK